MSSLPPPAHVSRETCARLRDYAALLEKWNKRINLVAPATISEFWARHIQDSAQVFDLAPVQVAHWVDLGSGGGLPGLVCAILAREQGRNTRFTLIESDQRKAAFLLTAAQALDLPDVTIRAQRIEQAPPAAADLVTARALAPLPVLLGFVHRHIAPGGIALLPKGKAYQTELVDAQKDWHFDVTSHQSRTEALARVLEIKDIHRA